MSTASYPTTYISRVANVSPSRAGPAYELLMSELLLRSLGRRGRHLPAGGRGCGLDIAASPARGSGEEMRRMPARVVYGLGSSVPVQVELRVWSPERTEVGIRLQEPVTACSARQSQRYFRVAHAVAEALRDGVERWGAAIAGSSLADPDARRRTGEPEEAPRAS